MRYLALIAVLLIAGCGKNWQSVRLTPSAPESCRYVKQLTCVAHFGGAGRCEKWHKKHAMDAGANTVVPLSEGTADYYACPING